MIIKSITGVTQDTLTFRKNVSALQIRMTHAKEVDYTTPQLEAWVNNTKKSKRVTFFPKSHIIDLVELGTILRERRISRYALLAAEVTVTGNAETVAVQTIPKIYSVTMQVDLTDGSNGVQIDGSDDITLEITGLDAATTYEIRSVEEHEIFVTKDANGVPIPVPVHAYDYEMLATKGERTAKFPAQGFERFAIEIANGFNSIEIGYQDGSNVKMEALDLNLLSADSFGTCYETRYLVPKVGGGNVALTDELYQPERNYVIPLDGSESYIQINVDEVAGAVPSLRVIALHEQVIG